MKKKLFLIFVAFYGILNAQLVSYQKIDSFTVIELQSKIDNLGYTGLLVPEFPVDVYRVMYRTEFLDSTTLVSGLLTVPRNTLCKVPLVNYAHGTTSRRFNVPSYNGSEKNIAIFFAALGNVVCASDYIGLGASSISLHPYMHGFSQVHSSLNLMRATRELKDELDLNLGTQIFSFGYSQGGFVSAALVKYVEQNYADEFKITAAAPMSGPYNMYGAQYRMVNSGQPYATPGYLPYVIFSYQMMYGNLYNNVSEAFKIPYDTLMPQLFNGQNSIGYINSQATPVPLDMIKDSVRSVITSDPSHPFNIALRDNDLLEWTPQTPMRLFYCEGDEQVSYRNAQIADSVWTYNGSPNISSVNHGNFNHGTCVGLALLGGKNYFNTFLNNGVEILVHYNENNNSLEVSIFNEDINDFDILWEDGTTGTTLYNVDATTDYSVTATHKVNSCSATKTVSKQMAVPIENTITGDFKFLVSPNPSKGVFSVETTIKDKQLEIVDVMGRQVFAKTISNSVTTIDLSSMPSGVYFLKVPSLNFQKKIIVE